MDFHIELTQGAEKNVRARAGGGLPLCRAVGTDSVLFELVDGPSGMFAQHWILFAIV